MTDTTVELTAIATQLQIMNRNTEKLLSILTDIKHELRGIAHQLEKDEII